jgi:hypothetical protein
MQKVQVAATPLTWISPSLEQRTVEPRGHRLGITEPTT